MPRALSHCPVPSPPESRSYAPPAPSQTTPALSRTAPSRSRRSSALPGPSHPQTSKIPNFAAPSFTAYHVSVPCSFSASACADFKNSATACSLPGFASTCAQIASFDILGASNGGMPPATSGFHHRQRESHAKRGCTRNACQGWRDFKPPTSSRGALTFLGAAHSILRFAAWLKSALWLCR